MRRIINRTTFEKGDNVIVKGVERKGTVKKRRGDFYNVTLEPTGKTEENNVYAGDMVKASRKEVLLDKFLTSGRYTVEIRTANNTPDSDKSLDIPYSVFGKEYQKDVEYDIEEIKEVVDKLRNSGYDISAMFAGVGIMDVMVLDEKSHKILYHINLHEQTDFVKDKAYLNSSRHINSRFYQNGGERFYTLSEVAQYLSALFFDLRTIHFLTTGGEFYTYHALAQELYEQTEDYYDDVVETAIGFDSDVSPMYVLPGDWNFVDEHGSLSTDGQVVQTLILDRLQKIYDILENVQEYDSMVSSKIDSMLEYYDKEIYKLRQALR